MKMYSRKFKTVVEVDVLCDDVGHYLDGRPFMLVQEAQEGSEFPVTMLALPAGIAMAWDAENQRLIRARPAKGIEAIPLVHAYMYEPEGENWDDFEMVLSWKVD